MTHLLVVYATWHGQAEKVATCVADHARESGVDVTLARVNAVPDSGLPEAVDAVLVVASIHLGAYEREMVRFIGAHCDALSDRPTALVSVSMSASRDDDASKAEVAGYVEALTARTGWTPAQVQHVGGALMYRRYNFLLRWLMKRIARSKGQATDTSRNHEFTDWGVVADFTGEFLGSLLS